ASSWANSTNANIINSQTVLSRNTALPPSGRTFIWTPALFTNSCDPNGNLIIYSNYDGGVLNINVDQNIPNLKIGICSYEGVTVNLSGTFVGNVTAVRYAGYNGANAHCSITPINTTINGVPPAITSINIYPASTIIVPNGSSNIVCAYQCNLGNNGGCNTTGQVAHYFLTHLGGTLRYQMAQYGCWAGTQLVSAGGNCCLVAQALPVELSYFSAHCTPNNEAVLEWETASEINNHYFTLERSTDGIVFEDIAVVMGMGTSSQPHAYRFVDAEAISETSYYRLRQTDYNGQSETFPVRVLERTNCMGNSSEIIGFPNPAADRFVIQLAAKDAGELMIYWSDIQGRIIRTERVNAVQGWNSFAFDIADLPSGSYTLNMDGTIPLDQNHLLLIKE
ncbi:MAG: T9SS type A sorting domain-containing protein, partial [Bacteroidia bacterium]